MNDPKVYYSSYYQDVTNTGLIGKVASISHRTMEKWPYASVRQIEGAVICELGAGQAQHYLHVKRGYSKYIMSDYRPELLNGVNATSKEIVIEKRSVDAHSLPYKNNEFDRLIATCLMIHLRDPEAALREWKRVVKDSGTISIYIPCESGIFLRILQSLSTRRKQYKLGLNAKYLHYNEHKFNYPFLIAIISEIFPQQFSVRKFPFIFGSFDLNLWAVVTISNKK